MSSGADRANNQSLMIMDMERKLNSKWFARRMQRDRYCTLSTNQFWDWLVYIDVSYWHPWWKKDH